MASALATNPDTLVTLKINGEGTNKRYKFPLRDLGASTLPEKVSDGPTKPERGWQSGNSFAIMFHDLLSFLS